MALAAERARVETGMTAPVQSRALDGVHGFRVVDGGERGDV